MQLPNKANLLTFSIKWCDFVFKKIVYWNSSTYSHTLIMTLIEEDDKFLQQKSGLYDDLLGRGGIVLISKEFTIC